MVRRAVAVFRRQNPEYSQIAVSWWVPGSRCGLPDLEMGYGHRHFAPLSSCSLWYLIRQSTYGQPI